MAAINQVFQNLAWLIALVQFIIGLYVLFLDPRGFAHRCVGISLLIISVDTFSIGVLVSEPNAVVARFLPQLLAAFSVLILAATLLTSLAVFRPAILHYSSRFPVFLVIIILGLIPLVFTLVDAVFGISLWHTGINPNSYTSGYLISDRFTSGWLGSMIYLLIFGFLGFTLLVLLGYTLIFDRHASRQSRFIALWLLSASLLTLLLAFGSFSIESALIVQLVTSLVYLIAYSYTAFSQVIVEPTHLHRGRLQILRFGLQRSRHAASHQRIRRKSLAILQKRIARISIS